MSLAEVAAGAALLSLVVYALTGGADFGGGVWDLLASGPRREAQRKLVERAIGPIWEANHVWLILVVVILFSAFPPAFAAIMTALHVPLTLVLLGIVLRGSAFVFRHHGDPALAETWGRVFAIASTVTPLALGASLGALSSGAIRVEGDLVTGGFFRPWLAPFPLAVGLLATCAFAWLAATYLTREAGDDAALADDFRRRAIGAGVATEAVALACGLLFDGPVQAALRAMWPLLLLGFASAAGGLWALATRRLALARPLVIARVALLVLGWGLAQRPALVVPDVTIASAAAPDATLRLLLGALALLVVIVAPSLALLLRVFKARPGDAAGAPG